MDADAGDGTALLQPTDASAPQLLTCAFCLATAPPGGQLDNLTTDSYRSLHPSVPQGVLEDDAPVPVVCTTCFNFLYREYNRKVHYTSN